MVGDIPDAIENEDIIVVEVPEEENNERQDTEKETARKNPKPCNMPECDSNFRQKYLVNTPMPGRIQVYLNRKLYDEIKNYLHVIAPEVSIASYIHPLKFNSHGNNINLFFSKSPVGNLHII